MYAEMFMQVPKDVVRAIIHKTNIPEGKLKTLSEFTSIMVNKRGNPTQQDVDTFLKAGYTEQHILSIILAIATKTLSNYTNHLFGTEPDDMAKTWDI
jgi:alkylhydroperoxidase family enzyme